MGQFLSQAVNIWDEIYRIQNCIIRRENNILNIKDIQNAILLSLRNSHCSPVDDSTGGQFSMVSHTLCDNFGLDYLFKDVCPINSLKG